MTGKRYPKRGDIIYRPAGAAAEYARWAANLYTGCSHGCKYCYAPACLRLKPEVFHCNPQPKARVLERLRKDAVRFAGIADPVLLCFTCDPYQPIEAEHRITRQAVEILGEAGIPICILTKNGALAMRDFDLFKKYDVEFGVTLHLTSKNSRKLWEPGAGRLDARFEAIRQAHDLGIRTWLSVEPVIYPEQALDVIREMTGLVDRWAVGKLNHHKKWEETIDWAEFLRQVVTLMEADGADYYIKKDLRKAAGRGEGD